MEKELREYLESKGVKVIVENVNELPEKEYAKIRTKGFGASDSSVIIGVNPFKSIEALMHEKLTGITDESISKKGSVKKGKELESLFIQKAEVIMNTTIIKPKDMYGNSDGINVNFDGVLKEHNRFIPAEVKLATYFGIKYYNFNRSLHGSEETTDLSRYADIVRNIPDRTKEIAKYYGVPVYYYTQLQQQIYLLDAPYGYLIVQNDEEWETYIWRIVRDKKLEPYLFDKIKYYNQIARIKRGEIKIDDTKHI